MTHKPLPDISASPVLIRLTIDSNILINRFIQRVVDEEGLDGSWIDTIKHALADFGEYLESIQIFAGLKATQKEQLHAQALEEAAAREHRKKERERLKEGKSGKGKGSDKVKENESSKAWTSPWSEGGDRDLKLKMIHALTSAPTHSTSASPLKHLFLTVTPLEDTPAESDADFDIIPALKACSFSADIYSFPFYDDGGAQGEGGAVICGLDNWRVNRIEASPQLVGGTFTFYNITSDTPYESLVTLLKLSVYTYMSLILEQHVLTNSQVILRFPKPPSLPSPFSPPPIPVFPLSPLSPRRKSRSNKASSGIWSFLSRKTEGIIHRVAGERGDALPRTSSLDLTSVFSSPKSPWRTRRASDDGSRPVVAVTETESASNTIKASHARVAEEEERRDRERFGPFTSTMRRIQDQHCVLSTSPYVNFRFPPLIAQLAEREEKHKHDEHLTPGASPSLSSSTSSVATVVPGAAHGPPTLKLTGVDKTGLGSVLGWEGREARGRGMASVRSFVRHQGLTVLYAEHVPIGAVGTRACGRPRWMTFRYWAKTSATDTVRDWTLGEMVQRLCDAAVVEERCETEGCDKPRGMHHISWTCAGVKVGVATKGHTNALDSGDDIHMWQTCAVCGKKTDSVDMGDGTYLFSFAKYLELLIWSPLLASVFLCDHTSAPLPSANDPALADSRFHILRHFSHKDRILTVTLTPVHNDTYEVRFPKLQVLSGYVNREKQLSETRQKREYDEERRVLEVEIDGWWHGVRMRLDKLEDFLEDEATQALESKDLPPLPLSDDESSDDEDITTTKPRNPSPSRPQTSRTISFPLASMGSLTTFQSDRASESGSRRHRPAAPYPPGLPISIRQSRELLGQLRASFQTAENSLRKQVSETPGSSLNDVRRNFRSTANGAFKRLLAWQGKHVPGAPTDAHGGDATSSEPEWWRGNCHAVPGGRVVVREGEWGSVIAFTLSSLDYQRELANLNAASGFPSSPALSATALSEMPSSPNATIKPVRTAARNPDPDENDAAVWEEAESWTAVITRREHPREFSLRDVLRNKRSFETSSLGSRFAGSVSRGVAHFTPPSAWAQPQVQVNLQAADGSVSQIPAAAAVVEKTLESQYSYHHIDSTMSSDYTSAEAGEVTPTPSSFVERHIRRGGASSIIAFDNPNGNSLSTQLPVSVPSKVESTINDTAPESGLPAQHSTLSSTLSDVLSHAMRYFLSTEQLPSRSPSPAPSGTHHGLLALEATSSIDDRPHIKYDWTIGKRLKFSCTVYYAKQFDALRKRCGVDDILIKSLERSENWTAVGGKSKSNFWKSADDRFIIKTLVNAWNVADLQVLIELAPSYFRYVDSTANKASVLAKLMGFYTVEVKNLETGSVQTKHDLLVMENLFYNQKVTKSFDLKGIQSRRVKPNNDGSEPQTLFDGEWIEGQQRTPLLIQPHSKHILQEAIRADADFLAKSNIMDYSLLLGIDEEHHEIACGLVDTIGSYTFAKTLEYKAKQNLNSGKSKEVTVIPPAEYHTRFVKSMESYFCACPDKWTKPPVYVDRITANDLASVV